MLLQSVIIAKGRSQLSIKRRINMHNTLFLNLVSKYIMKGTLVFLVFGTLLIRVAANDVPPICTERGADSIGAAALSDRVWKGKTVLKVQFLDGSEFLKKQVRYYAQFWSNYANIKFEFVEKGPSDIRVSFTKDGSSWSYIGNSAKNVADEDETMHFGWFDETTEEVKFRRTILHEFGHALGLIHEHQSPGSSINWNKPVVYQYYKNKFDWNKNVVNDNIFLKYTGKRTQYTKYDPDSIMHYSIPAAFTLDNSFVGWNTNLSQKDKEFIKKLYP